MKNMKLITLVLAIVFQSAIALAQDDVDRESGIVITPIILEEKVEMPTGAQRVLLSKLNQILTNNGVSGGANSRFVITPSISVYGKEVVSSAPVKLVYDMELSLSIGDGLTGDKFVSETMPLKGIGTNETKAYISAVKNIKPRSSVFKSFVASAKAEIVSFYNSNCEVIIAEAKRQESLGNPYGALSELVSIPSESSNCLEKSTPLLKSLYNKAVVSDCSEKLNRAKGIWSANQNGESANLVGALLSTVSPDANCYGEVETLFNEVSQSVKESNKKAWDYILIKSAQESERIEAIRAVGVAYGSNQPSPMYLIAGW